MNNILLTSLQTAQEDLLNQDTRGQIIPRVYYCVNCGKVREKGDARHNNVCSTDCWFGNKIYCVTCGNKNHKTYCSKECYNKRPYSVIDILEL